MLYRVLFYNETSQEEVLISAKYEEFSVLLVQKRFCNFLDMTDAGLVEEDWEIVNHKHFPYFCYHINDRFFHVRIIEA